MEDLCVHVLFDDGTQKLFGFERLVAMKPGESRQVTFAAGPADLANADATGRVVLQPGAYGVEIGDVVAPAMSRVSLAGKLHVLDDALSRHYWQQQQQQQQQH